MSIPAETDFTTLLRACEPGLRAMLRSLVVEPADCEDIFQETSQTLWRKFHTFDHNRPFGAWARGIAVRKVMEAQRRLSRSRLVFSHEVMERLASAVDQALNDGAQARETALQHCLGQLPEKSRQVLTWRYQDQWSCSRIAQQSGQQLDAIYQTLSRLRTQLGACIEARLGLKSPSLKKTSHSPIS